MNRPLFLTWHQIAVGALLMMYVAERMIDEFVDSLSDDDVALFLAWIQQQGLI